MKLDRNFSNQIRKEANGDGSREAKFDFFKRVRAAKKALSTTSVRDTFDMAIKEHGRVPVAICVAATVVERKDRLEYGSYLWGLAVLDLWKQPFNNMTEAVIEDGLHPSRIEEYAGSFIRLTTDY